MLTGQSELPDQLPRSPRLPEPIRHTQHRKLGRGFATAQLLGHYRRYPIAETANLVFLGRNQDRCFAGSPDDRLAIERFDRPKMQDASLNIKIALQDISCPERFGRLRSAGYDRDQLVFVVVLAGQERFESIDELRPLLAETEYQSLAELVGGRLGSDDRRRLPGREGCT